MDPNSILLWVVLIMAFAVIGLAALNVWTLRRPADENAPIPWAELRRWRAEMSQRVTTVEEQTRAIRDLTAAIADMKSGLHQMSSRVENMAGVVSTIANERLAERAARESRWEDRQRAGDVTVNTGPLAQQGGAGFHAPTTVQGGVAGGGINTIQPPKPTERAHRI